MNLQVSFDSILESKGPVVTALSGQVAYHLAQILEVLGISSIRIAKDETIGGFAPYVAEISFFDEVPPEIVQWADPAKHGLASMLYAFGMMALYLELDPEGGELGHLRSVWDAIIRSRPEAPRLSSTIDAPQDAMPDDGVDAMETVKTVVL